jgi:hypothetical protein
MTSTHDPLSVRTPLYPFSHSRIFQNAASDVEGDIPGSHIAPLPSPPPMDEDLVVPPTNTVAWRE